MKIVIPGGSGQVGTVLARAFHKRGDEVVVLSRKPIKTAWRCVQWDGETLGDWVSEIEGADALINLAGQSVNCRYNEHNRRFIKDSRLKVQPAIQDEQVRVTSKSRDELQTVIAAVRTQDLPVAVQFVNFRD